MQAFLWDKLFEAGLTEVDVQHQHLLKLINELGRRADIASLARPDETLTALAASWPCARHKRSQSPRHV
ncbi:MAG TPA: hypothetical protein PLB25_06525 [Rhodoferax sp.]|nr:hypothetical protein [Rhodoferax sp.]